MMTNTDMQKTATEAITNKLNRLLADYQVIYAHLHALHWNVEGKQFFTAHRELETMYDQVAEFIDDVAERILTLGNRPATTLKEYIEMSELDELSSRKYDSDEVAELVLKDLDYSIAQLRALIETAGEYKDEGTADFGVEMLRELEKQRWFWSAFSG
jgi:starvation-inducible DNA-binding protein